MMMTKATARTLAAVALVSGAVGCGRKEGVPEKQQLSLTPGVHLTNTVVRSYKDLQPGDVLVQVGSHALTRSALQERVQEWMDLQKTGATARDPAGEARLEQAANQYVFANFMARAAMLNEAARRRVAPDAADLQAAEDYINQICKRLRVKRAAFAQRFEGGEAAITQRIRDEATLKAVLRDEFGSLFNVSDEDAANLKRDLERLRDRAQATNRVFAACLAQVRERLVSGELQVTDDQESLQAALPEDVTFEGINTLQAFDFDFPQTREALARLKPGEWSPLVEVDEAFEIYQLRAVETNADPDLTVYTFVKFSVLRDIGWEVPDIEQLKKDIARRRRNERQAPWVRDLMTKHGVLYPNGVQLFAQAQKPAAQPAPGMLMKQPAAGVKHVHGQKKEKVAE
ncbi:MAG: hypothetical protein FJ222_05300 [Lentisphaerae bacterium]|nr:hypothetical protein [Lentisphaerota bacterium]